MSKHHNKNIINNTRFIFDDSNDLSEAHIDVTATCVICNSRVTRRGSSFKRNNVKCPICSGGKVNNNEWFERLKYLKPAIYNKFNFDISIYKGYTEYMDVTCIQCGCVYKIKPSKIDIGQWCKSCSRKNRVYGNQHSGHQFIIYDFIHKCVLNNIYEFELDDSVIFTGINDIATMRCTECGHYVNRTAYNFSIGKVKCAICNGGKPREYEWLYRLIYKKPFILSEISFTDYNYTGYFDRMNIMCKVCGHIWDSTPHNIDRGVGCPECNSSNGERSVMKWFDTYNIQYEREKSYSKLVGIGGSPLRYDFYLPKYNILIEYDGRQHFIPIISFGGLSGYLNTRNHDKRKNEYCDKHGIRLIRIRYDESIDETLKCIASF